MKKLVLALAIISSFKAVAGSKYESWGNNFINLPNNVSGTRDVVIGVVDTGIDTDHKYLKNNIMKAVDFSHTNAKDGHGHGTHIAGIIKSIFPQVKLVSLKYYNPNFDGQESLDATLRALKYAVDSNVDIINYSGGGPEASLQELKILKNAERKGILVICASGNERADIDTRKNAFYPASYGLSNIIAVSAHDENNKTL